MENYVITIARGYGSGGKEIGTKLSEKLGIPLIDRELLQMASDVSGISESLFNISDEKVKKTLFLKRADYSSICTPENKNFISDTNLFNYQAKVLRIMAQRESFIVIGRAANYVLRTFPNVVSINIQAPFEYCVMSIMSRLGITREEAEKEIKSIDRYRKDFYKYYTGNKWNDIENFDLFLNSARNDQEECVDVIIDFTEKKLKRTIKKG